MEKETSVSLNSLVHNRLIADAAKTYENDISHYVNELCHNYLRERIYRSASIMVKMMDATKEEDRMIDLSEEEKKLLKEKNNFFGAVNSISNGIVLSDRHDQLQDLKNDQPGKNLTENEESMKKWQDEYALYKESVLNPEKYYAKSIFSGIIRMLLETIVLSLIKTGSNVTEENVVIVLEELESELETVKERFKNSDKPFDESAYFEKILNSESVIQKAGEDCSYCLDQIKIATCKHHIYGKSLRALKLICQGSPFVVGTDGVIKVISFD